MPVAKPIIIDNKYKIGSRVGRGAFAEVFEAQNVQTGEMAAVKMEPVNAKHPQLAFEAQVYRYLAGGAGISKAFWYGSMADHNMFVVEMLGCNMEDLLERVGHKFSLKTTLMLADQMISRMEYVHGKGFIHRDIKPENFLMGRGEHSALVYVVDFGLAKRYIDPRTRKHIPYREDKSLTGTVRYASINNHLGFEQSRRDDLESLGYMLIYFLKGRLPWQGLIAHNGKPIDVAQRKMLIPLEELCSGLPHEFVSYLEYVRSLKFDQTPDYLRLRTSFLTLFAREGYSLDYKWDWLAPSSSSTSTTIAAAANGAHK